jgi:hypothetical protein
MVNLLKNITAFWDAAPCSLTEIDQRFRGAYCLIALRQQIPLKHRSISTKLHAATFLKAVIFIIAAVRT